MQLSADADKRSKRDTDHVGFVQVTLFSKGYFFIFNALSRTRKTNRSQTLICGVNQLLNILNGIYNISPLFGTSFQKDRSRKNYQKAM